MTSYNERCRLAGLSLGAAVLLAPLSFGFQRPPPAPFGTHEVPAQVGCLGYGKGELALPMMGKDGRLSGGLVDNDGQHQFRLEALLTGMMPNVGVGGQDYMFGGLYGKVWKAGNLRPPVVPSAASYDVEGGWELFGGGKGQFHADALRYSTTGQAYVVGEIYGKFQVSSDGTIGLTATWGTTPGKTAPRDWSDAGTNWTPPDWSDAASAPHKPRTKVPWSDRASNPPDYTDAASAPHKPKVKSRYSDAGSRPEVQQVGAFCVRFHFDE